MRTPSRELTLSYLPQSCHSPHTSPPSPPLSRDDASLACGTFISSLCDLLGDRLGHLEGLFGSFKDASAVATVKNVDGADCSSEGKSAEKSEEKSEENGDDNETQAPLCHGLMLAMRYCLKELHSSGLLTPGTSNPTALPIISTVWRPLVNRVLTLSLDALRVAMLVVAEAPCDVQFAPAPTAKLRGEYTLGSGLVEEGPLVAVKVLVSVVPRCTCFCRSFVSVVPRCACFCRSPMHLFLSFPDALVSVVP